MTQLSSDDVKYVSDTHMTNVLTKQNIATINVFAKSYNLNRKRPLKVKNAQSMLQVLYKDVCAYLPIDINDE
jgi:hypothetical protein